MTRGSTAMRDRLNIFGIDIVKGSVRSRSRRPMYALVRMEGRISPARATVSMFRLFRLLSEERPDILAVDSLQEIAADQHGSSSFCRAFRRRRSSSR